MIREGRERLRLKPVVRIASSKSDIPALPDAVKMSFGLRL